MKKILVKYTHDNTVARVILTDGKGNVLDHLMMGELPMVADVFGTTIPMTVWRFILLVPRQLEF